MRMNLAMAGMQHSTVGDDMPQGGGCRASLLDMFFFFFIGRILLPDTGVLICLLVSRIQVTPRWQLLQTQRITAATAH